MTITSKQQQRELERARQAKLIDDEHQRLAIEHAMMLDFIYMAAARCRNDGTYNNSRTALEQKAKLVLDELGF